MQSFLNLVFQTEQLPCSGVETNCQKNQFLLSYLLLRQFVTRHWQVEYACCAALTPGTKGIMRLNQCSRLIYCYELSPVTNCRLLRIVACCELSPHSIFCMVFKTFTKNCEFGCLQVAYYYIETIRTYI